MGRQARTLRVGEHELENGITVASSAKLGISNYGVTELPSTAAVEYVLDAPVEGVRKTLYSVTTTSAAVVVRGSTGATVTFDNQGSTQITFNATIDMLVDLLGVSATRWMVTNAYPAGLAVNSTGIVVGTS